MAIEDYIPNVFGQGMPSYIPGLLGQEEAAALQKRANVQGLLGAALSLAQGMSGQGPRRSAAQNVLGAIAGGLQAGQGAYQGAISQFADAQKLAQMQRDAQNAARTRAAVEDALKDPRIANDPAMRAALMTDPAGTLKMLAENAPIQQAITGGAPQPQGAVMGEVPPMPAMDGAPAMPQMTVTASNRLADLEQRRRQLMDVNSRLANVPGDKAARMREANIKDIADIRKEIENLSVSGYDFSALEQSVPEQLKPFVREVKEIAGTGGLTANELAQRVGQIQTAAIELGKGQKYDGIVGQYARFMFGSNDSSKLTREQNANILAYASAPTEAERTKIEIDAQKLAAERGIRVQIPASREALAGGVTPQAPVGVAPAVEARTEKPAKPSPVVDIGKGVTPLINQPESRVPLATKQDLIAKQNPTIQLANYTLKNIVDARDAAQRLLDNPEYLEALSGPSAAVTTKIPGTTAFTANELLKNLLGRSFITEIQQMRQASPTGGAVGNVAVAEMESLSKIQSALTPGIKKQELRKQIEQYINSANRSLKTIPNEYARTYGYQGEFDEILRGGVVERPRASRVDDILKKYGE